MRSALGYKEVRDKQYPHFEDLHRKLVLKRLPVPVPDLPPRKPAGDKKQVCMIACMCDVVGS